MRHLRQSGFTVRVRAHRDLAPVRAALGVPTPLAGCHTALVAGYVVEGHVPAGAIARLFDTRPEAVGLAVPGMPAGSPGMEGPLPAEVYDVLLFNAEAARGFARYEGGAVQAWAAPVAP
ncbi:DUF411 domain-containing protein [Rhodothalassium salexigens]|uniref:DUF411 domain-containing protein n=1 Tax=Rhodothalassium salexigens TaxID=1086 RepID=UPI00191354BE